MKKKTSQRMCWGGVGVRKMETEIIGTEAARGGSLHDPERAADSGGGQFAGEDVAFPQREESVALAKTRFVGGAGDAFNRARGLGSRDGLVAKNIRGFDDRETEAVGRASVPNSGQVSWIDRLRPRLLLIDA